MQFASWQAALCAGAFGIVIGAWLSRAARRLRERSRGRQYNLRGRRAEHDAELLLQAHGYRVLEHQPRISYRLEVGGTSQEVPLIFDFLVERSGERLAAEVKSGTSAPRIAQADTRRQLLEYQLALGSSRVLLVDPQQRRITEIAFPIARPAGRPWASPWAWALLAMGLLIAGLWLWRRTV